MRVTGNNDYVAGIHLRTSYEVGINYYFSTLWVEKTDEGNVK